MVVLSAVALIPSAPVLLPRLAASAAAEIADLHDAVLRAAAALPQRWIAVGVTESDVVVGPEAAGTFAGYGVDLIVGLGPGAGAVADLPLCALVAGWARQDTNPSASVRVLGYAASTDGATAQTHGRALRAEIEASDEPIGVLVVADGLSTLTPPAPGGFDPDSPPVQAALDDALAVADVAALLDLSDAVVGRVAYQVLAGLVGDEPVKAQELYRGAPYGVGYFVGIWR